MTRKEFIQLCGIFGIGLPLQTSLSSCEKEVVSGNKFSGKVIIIGAGAGGLSSGYLLKQQGVEFEILEASPINGGRMKINSNFADFPIPLGAEWLETSTDIFQKIVNDAAVKVNITTVVDSPDRKFVNYSWFNFFEEYITPSVSENIIYNNIVKSIDYSDSKVIVTTQNGQYIADKVVLSVPLKILQNNEISFVPPLSQNKKTAIQSVTVWEGFKAFFEFSKKFYDDDFERKISSATDGKKIYYNAAFGQKTNKNIVGLFTVGKPAVGFISLSDDEVKQLILKELDVIHANQATPNYVKHISQNWSKEPFIKGGYLSDYADWRTVKKLKETVADKIFFAGAEYTDGEDWGSVHTAALSAKSTVAEILN